MNYEEHFPNKLFADLAFVIFRVHPEFVLLGLLYNTTTRRSCSQVPRLT